MAESSREHEDDDENEDEQELKFAVSFWPEVWLIQ
jgi:hypothetical protein